MKVGLKKRIINLLKNIKFLSEQPLYQEFDSRMYETLLHAEDMYKYERWGEQEDINTLDILNYSDTLDLLTNSPASFCRLGDGEINLIQGKSIPFQEYDEKLADILFDILHNNHDGLYVGINYNLFHPTNNLNEFNRRFYLVEGKKYRDFLLTTCCRDRTYIAAAFNQLYIVMEDYDFDTHFKKIEKMFADKDVVLFAGKGIVQSLEYNIFDVARTCEYVEGPTRNAFSDFDAILNTAREYPKSKTICFILGPASKALVFELAKEGYMAWDVGHLAKDYDAYRRNVKKTPTEITKFFKPD